MGRGVGWAAVWMRRGYGWGEGMGGVGVWVGRGCGLRGG